MAKEKEEEIPLPPTFFEGFHNPNVIRKMRYTKLGRTHIEASLLSFGGGSLSGFYGEFEENEAIEVVREAIRNGVNYIDTAPYYGEGRSETVIGKALQGIPRNAYYISTKVGRYSSKPEEMFNYSAEKIKSRFETSLQLLGLDYVDLVILHDVEFSRLEVMIKQSLPALWELVQAGKAKHIGVSGYPLVRIAEVVSKTPVPIDVVLTYARDTLIDCSLKNYYQYFKSMHLGLIGAAPTALQLLTNAGPPEWHLANQKTKEIVNKAVEYCKENDVELGKLAVYHGLSSSFTETLLIGMNSMKLLKINLEIAYNGLTKKESEVLKYISNMIFKPTGDLHWEGEELAKYNMDIK